MSELTPREIAEGLAQFRDDAVALDERMQKLIKSHPKHWAGMCKGELWIGTTLQEVVDHFGGGRNVVIKYLDPEPKVWIFAHLVSAASSTRQVSLEHGWLRRDVDRAVARVKEWKVERAKNAQPVRLQC